MSYKLTCPICGGKLDGVSIRAYDKKKKQFVRKLGYKYCPKCDKFFKVKLVEVK